MGMRFRRAVAVLGGVLGEWIWIVSGMFGAFLLVREVLLGAEAVVGVDAVGEFFGGERLYF
jgi:hypothetical protein